MFRIHLLRLFALGAATILVGCQSSGGGLCSTCGDKPGLFSRFRTTSSSEPVVISSGDSCDRGAVVNGPFLPPMQQQQQQPGMILPNPQPNTNIQPRIDENGKQGIWDPKMSSRPIGTKTGTETRTIIKQGN